MLSTKQAQLSLESVGPYQALGVVDNWSALAIPGLLSAIGKLDLDVIHVQHAASSYGHKRAIGLIPPLLKLARWKGKLLVTAHEYGGWGIKHLLLPSLLFDTVWGFAERGGFFDREDLFLLAGSDRVIVTNDHHYGYIAARMPSIARKLEILPIGANILPPDGDRTRLAVGTRKRWGMAKDSPLIVFFGFIHPVKGLERLITAFARVREEYPEAKLVMAGGFESLSLPGDEAEAYRKKLENLVGELELANSAHFSGFLPAEEISGLLAAADLCVLPFNHGATLKSGSLMAALQHRVPVVTTIGDSAAPELVDGQNVLLVPPRDSEALASAIGVLLSTPWLRAKLSKEGLALAERFSWEDIVDRHLRIYGELGVT